MGREHSNFLQLCLDPLPKIFGTEDTSDEWLRNSQVNNDVNKLLTIIRDFFHCCDEKKQVTMAYVELYISLYITFHKSI